MSYTTCGSGGCGCAGSTDNLPQEEAAPVARINGVPLHADGEILPPDALRQRACTELLRQQAQREGLIAAPKAKPKPERRPGAPRFEQPSAGPAPRDSGA